MAYLIRQDYDRLIPSQHLSQLVAGDFDLLMPFETAAVEEISSYLVQKYDTAAELTSTDLWAYGTTYKAKNRVYINATAFSASATYAQYALVLYSGSVYYANVAIPAPAAWDATKFTLVGKQYALFYATTPKPDWDYYTAYEAGNQVYYSGKTYTAVRANEGSNPAQNPADWGTGSTYNVTGTIRVWDTNYWTAGDNRNQQMVLSVIDVVLFHLHTRISPSNVPEYRAQRYDNAIAWLKSCAKGDYITSGLKRIQPNQGARIRRGGSLPKQNNNF